MNRGISNFGLFKEMLENIPQGTSCLEWPLTRVAGGYGRLRYKGRKFCAHRLAYEITHGRIPDGLEICHKCDNPPCFRPDHLFAGTTSQNMLDCVSKGRYVVTRGRALVTEAQVIEIRSLWSMGESVRSLADQYKIRPSTVANIVRWKTWKHVGCAEGNGETLSRTYMKRTCWVCQREISSNGLAQLSHMRAHVRKAEVVELVHRDLSGLPYSTFRRKPQELPEEARARVEDAVRKGKGDEKRG